jgi:sugar lactone lactonase YvrE
MFTGSAAAGRRGGVVAAALWFLVLGSAGSVRASFVTNWSSSQAYPAARVSPVDYPRFYAVFLAGWREVAARDDGWVDLTASLGAAPGDSLCAMVRTPAQVDSVQGLRLDLAASGVLRLFLNGDLVPSTRGTSGYDLTLRPGRNEILLKVYSAPGGWCFRVDAERPLPPPRRTAGACRTAWETPATFLTPESVLHDAGRGVLYVSSFDNQYEQRDRPTGYISRLGLDGVLLDAQWITGLRAPCGMAIRGDRLFVAVREGVAEIDISRGVVAALHPIPDAVFPNDVAIDAHGRVYVSDTRPSLVPPAVSVWRLSGQDLTPWLITSDVGRANGLLVAGEELLVGSTQGGCLKAVNLESRVVRTVISLGAGVVDGLRSDGRGGVLVSFWEGQLFHLDADGRLTELLDLLPAQRNTADFEYLPDRRLLLIPTFLANTVAAYEIAP